MDTPTPDEIRRVAEYWQNVKALGCDHPEMVFESSAEGLMCGSCRRPIRFMSDIQIDALRKA